MSYFVTTKEQKSILQSDKPLLNIGYFDSRKALVTIAHLCMESLKTGKKTWIYMPHSDDRAMFQKIFEKMGLDELLLNTNLQDDISAYKSRFLSNESQSKDHFDLVKYHLKDLEFSRMHMGLIDYSSYRNSITRTGQTRRQILDNYIQLPPHTYTEYLYNILNSREAYDIDLDIETSLKIIEQARSIYSPNFDFISSHQTHLGVKPTLINSIYIIDTLKTLKNVLASAQDLRLRYHQCQLEILSALNEKDKTWCQNQYDLISKIERLYSVYKEAIKSKKEPGFLASLLGAKDEQHEKLANSIVVFYEMLMREISDRQLIQKSQPKDIFQNLEIELKEYKQLIDGVAHKSSLLNLDYIKHINKLNFRYNKLSELESELENLFEDINSKDIFNQRIEANSISFVKQIYSLEALISQLNKSILGLENNKTYIEWNEFLNQLDPQQKTLINALLQMPNSEWQQLYLSYEYFKELHSTLKLHKDVDIFDLMEELLLISNKKLIKDYQKKRENALADFKKNNIKLYNYIIKGKSINEPTNWKWCLSKYSPSFSEIFPFLVIDNDDVADFSQDMFDTLIIYNAPEVSPNILQLSPRLITFWDNYNGQDMDFVLNVPLTVSENIIKVSVSQRYALAQSLSKILMSVGQLPRIFALKNTSVISYSSEGIENMITEDFYSLGIKRMSLSEDPYELLESVLIDSTENVFVIIEDGYFVSHDVCDILEQELIKKNLKASGIIILDISTESLFRNSENILLSLKQSIQNRL